MMLIVVGIGSYFAFDHYGVLDEYFGPTNIEENIFDADTYAEKYPNAFYKVTDNANGDIFLDPKGGAKPESTIIFLHDQFKNNEDIYKLFSTP